MMKTAGRIAALIMVLVLSVALLNGCAMKKTGMQRAEKTTSSMQAVESDINQSVGQINATNASLNGVIAAKDSPDVQKAYDEYAKNVSKMDKTGNALLKHTTQMTARGNDYFEEWQKSGTTYTNPRIQALSQERRNELQTSFNRIAQSSPGVTGSLNSYLSNLKQIQTFLSNDLTPQGIAAISSVVRSTISSGDKVKKDLQPMQSAIVSARSNMFEGRAAGGTSQKTGPSGTTAPSENPGTSGGSAGGSTY